MDDFEINKRLAEIAGVDVVQDDFGMPWSVKNSDRHWCPLCDWSQLGPLMERHHVHVGPEYGEMHEEQPGVWAERLEKWVAVADEPGSLNGGTVRIRQSPDLKRAVCMAIIAAHEENE